MPELLLPTTVVGSYPQPDWLVNREMLSKTVPRVRMDIWRVPQPWLEQAQDDATLLAIRDMERAGIDIITDGEMRRESYSNRFATALEGHRHGAAGPRQGALGARDAGAARSGQDPTHEGGRSARHAVPARQHRPHRQDHAARPLHHEPAGARTSSTATRRRWLMDYAIAVNQEARELEKAGADVIQLDEPWLQERPRGGQAHRRQGHQPRARGAQGADHRAPVLRLCGAGTGRDQARRLLVPAAARRQRPRSRSRSRPRSPSSTSACSRTWRAKR